MHYFPGEPWDSWYDKPYELVMAAVEFIDEKVGNAGGGEP